MSRVIAVAIPAIALAAASVITASQQRPFRAGVDVVELSAAVTSGKAVVADLTAADFEVLDNGVRQEVLSSTRELLPIDVVLVLDTSDSLTPALESAILSGANRIRERLHPDDRASLMTFNQRIEEQLKLDRPAAMGRISLGQKAGQTSLNDAIGVALATRPVMDRRQMAIVFTDGYDSTSLLTEADVMLLAGRSRTALFLVSQSPGLPSAGGGRGVSSHVTTEMPQPRSEPLAGAPVAAMPASAPYPTAFFERLAAATGGLSQSVPQMGMTTTVNGVTIRANSNLLDEPFLTALDDFRSSYVVRYALTGVPRPGWHTVAVKVIKPGKSYTVRTRSGYAG